LEGVGIRGAALSRLPQLTSLISLNITSGQCKLNVVRYVSKLTRLTLLRLQVHKLLQKKGKHPYSDEPLLKLTTLTNLVALSLPRLNKKTLVDITAKLTKVQTLHINSFLDAPVDIHNLVSTDKRFANLLVGPPYLNDSCSVQHILTRACTRQRRFILTSHDYDTCKFLLEVRLPTVYILVFTLQDKFTRPLI